MLLDPAGPAAQPHALSFPREAESGARTQASVSPEGSEEVREQGTDDGDTQVIGGALRLLPAEEGRGLPGNEGSCSLSQLLHRQLPPPQPHCPPCQAAAQKGAGGDFGQLHTGPHVPPTSELPPSALCKAPRMAALARTWMGCRETTQGVQCQA